MCVYELEAHFYFVPVTKFNIRSNLVLLITEIDEIVKITEIIKVADITKVTETTEITKVTEITDLYS